MVPLSVMYESYVNILSIFAKVVSLALEQSNDFPMANEVTWDDKGNIDQYQTIKKQNTALTVCLIIGRGVPFIATLTFRWLSARLQ